ncbi:MAG: hypothetical protein J5802_01670 [Butyrivibrio sp.]|nr:hypothetical protein [Butyrivibrio sp.]
MKIAQSNVNLISNSTYHESTATEYSTKIVSRGSFNDNLKAQREKNDSESGNNSQYSSSLGNETALESENYNSLKPTKSSCLRQEDASLEEQIMAIRTSLLRKILEYMQLLGGNNKTNEFRSMLESMTGMLNSGGMLAVTTVQETHIQEQSVSFQSTGTALTEDGRCIDFGVSFSMSSRLVQSSGISISSPVNFIDPLVINVSSEVTSISDQSFYFDLNCDGEDDKLSYLAPGAGFLAYDKNEDGRINDGSELFGTKSGNGFKDLSAYDHDGNGWIDENDEIFNKLKVWLRNDDGTDTLLSLKEADVGAIYLGSSTTNYAMYDSSFNTSAMLRSSGIFLRESGGVGTVQQVDLVAHK